MSACNLNNQHNERIRNSLKQNIVNLFLTYNISTLQTLFFCKRDDNNDSSLFFCTFAKINLREICAEQLYRVSKITLQYICKSGN